MFVGEQPGDAEDRAGHPFVGPAGGLLDRALEAANIDRDEVYVTNAVKHFKWKREEGTKRRIHSKPSAAEVRACSAMAGRRDRCRETGRDRVPRGHGGEVAPW